MTASLTGLKALAVKQVRTLKSNEYSFPANTATLIILAGDTRKYSRLYVPALSLNFLWYVVNHISLLHV